MTNPEEYINTINRLQTELDAERARSGRLAKSTHSIFGTPTEENLIRWQLDLKEELERIYHLLRGDIVSEDEDGNVVYKEPDDPNLKPFNEFGVQMLMNIISFYLNRNTLLSNYDENTINWKVLDFGYDVSDLIFNRYEEMMVTINTNDHKKIEEHLDEKIKMFPIIVRELVDSVHSAYLRALNGGERESLRTARTVTQTEPLTAINPYQNIMPQKKASPFKPWTWGRG